MVGGRGERGYRARRTCTLTALVLAVASVCVLFAAPALARSGGASVKSARHGSFHRHGVRRRSHSTNPLTRRAMWIWELQFTQGGNLGPIISQAHRRGMGTLMIKSSDGSSFWTSQFNSPIVSAFHRAGLKVCAWQYVYGIHPVNEAYKGAEAVRDGADCLLIDAEAQYEGRYVAAQTYIRRLRDLIGRRFPVALASFPYVDFHPAFPYSVFLGPGGAQYNMPQMYWKDIGVSVDGVFAHTYIYNMPYRRKIFPLCQVSSSPPGHQIFRFRQISRAYDAHGVSWWVWQQASPAGWTAISRPAGSLPGYTADKVMVSIGKGAVGDLVVWAQEHLISAGYRLGVDGGFGPTTRSAVQDFQTAHGLTPDGIIGPQTWGVLLRYRPPAIRFMARAAFRHGRLARSAGERTGGALVEPVPKSASRPEKRDELPGASGAGRPKHS
jgi:hypothetical protein